jgi:2-dehydro-3-deoxyphosphogluconate aldolase / (4S)-4-hydroxy-2-oxoglutarate aldolase
MVPEDFVELFRAERASAILRTHDQRLAREAMCAAIGGGFRIVEFTLSIPGAFSLIEEFAPREGLIVGAGTVLTANDARRAVQAGAAFLVSPVVDEIMIAEATALQVAAMPGCSSPTEMLRAHRAGAPLHKLFPEQGIGPRWVRQTLGPLPFLKIVPTAGVTLDNAAEYLQAGSFAVGFVNALFDPHDIAQQDWRAIERRAAQMRSAVEQAALGKWRMTNDKHH